MISNEHIKESQVPILTKIHTGVLYFTILQKHHIVFYVSLRKKSNDTPSILRCIPTSLKPVIHIKQVYTKVIN